jgi:S-adenosylmethionine synthetase
MSTFIFSSEAVTEGHPDKVCDLIADSILDAHLEQDSEARVACEVLAKASSVVIAGEISSKANVDHSLVVREAIRSIGYADPDQPFSAEGVRIDQIISEQAPEIERGIREGGAGDQGIMFGYASDETPELMPLPILLAQRLARGLAEARHSGAVPWLRPDAKTQVAVRYEAGSPARVEAVLVSTQHAAKVTRNLITEWVRDELLPVSLGSWHRREIQFRVNSAGTFEQGGPAIDCGVTGRKIIADGYGGWGRHGGGAFSGKDPSKVDRSGAYFCRYVAREIVRSGISRRAEVQVAYAIGRSEPFSLHVDTFGTGDAEAARRMANSFDFSPNAMIESLRLRRPIYRLTSNYGHFGRSEFSWEQPKLAPRAAERLLASESGVRPYAVLMGAQSVNEGLRLQVFSAQSPGSGRRIEGAFALMDCGWGPYSDLLRPWQGSVLPSARKLLERVKREPGGERCTHILNLNMLTLADDPIETAVEKRSLNDKTS